MAETEAHHQNDGGFYALCVAAHNNEAEILRCVTDRFYELRKDELSLRAALEAKHRSLYLVVCAALVFFMQGGFAMVCAGAVRRKNVQNTMLKNLLDACGSAVAFFLVGYAFAFGDDESDTGSPNSFIGTTNFFMIGVDDFPFWIFQYTFSAAAATIIAGALAERCQMGAYFYYSTLLTGFVYPVVAHAFWSDYGFLSATRRNQDPLFGVGVIDIAGSGVVHLLGGTCALVSTSMLGPRRGRFHNIETGEVLRRPKVMNGSSISIQTLGTLMLWFGWYGFNLGSVYLLGSKSEGELIALAMANTSLAGGAAGITAFFANLYVSRRTTGRSSYDLIRTMNGVLTGLVSITAGCAVVEPFAAVLIGFFSGGTYLCLSQFLISMRIDDTVDAIPVHLGGGLLGMISVGLFASPVRLKQIYGHNNHIGLLYSIFRRLETIDGTLLFAQILGILFVIGWTVGIMLPFFALLDSTGLFRSDPFDELVGLDKSCHGGVQLEETVEEAAKEAITLLKQRMLKSARQGDEEQRESALQYGSSLDLKEIADAEQS